HSGPRHGECQMFSVQLSKLHSNKKGLTVLETMLAVAIIGIIATLATASYATYLRSTKEAEAEIAMKRFGDLATTYFYATHYDKLQVASNGPVLIGADQVQTTRQFPVDNTCSAGALSGTKTSAQATDWTRGVWGELGFNMDGAHYYQYCYSAKADGSSFMLLGQARLMSDDIDSRFVLMGEKSGL